MLAFRKLRQVGQRVAVSRKQLESAVTEAVKTEADCEAVCWRHHPTDGTEISDAAELGRPGRAVRQTDRDKCGTVLAIVVETDALEFSLTDQHDDALPANSAERGSDTNWSRRRSRFRRERA